MSNLAQLYKTRRRWKTGLASLLILALALYITLEWAQIRKRGWRAMIPSSVLVLAAPVGDSAWIRMSNTEYATFGAPKNALLDELLVRFNERTLSPRQMKLFCSRVFTEFPSEATRLVRTRDKWPAECPLYAVPTPPWFFESTADGDYVRLRVAGSDEWTYIAEFRFESCVIGRVPPGMRQIDIQYEFWIGGSVSHSSGRPVVQAESGRRIWSGMARRVEIVDEPDHAIQASDSPSVTASIASAFSWSIARDNSGHVRLGMQQLHLPSPQHLAIGLRVEILHNDELRGLAEVLHFSPMPRNMVDTSKRYYPIRWLGGLPTDGQLATGSWSARLIGDPAVAVMDCERSNYWSGSVIIDLGLD